MGKDFLMIGKLPSFVEFTKEGVNGDSLVTIRGISLVLVLCKIYSGILAGSLRDWLINNKTLSRFHMGFVKVKRTTDNIFVIKTKVDGYVRVERSCIYWCLVDLEKAFDSTDRVALLFKMRKKGVSASKVECIKKCMIIPNSV
jgi:hypothetical protein